MNLSIRLASFTVKPVKTLHKKIHLLEYEVYEVTEDFPKITPNHHKGISAAKYSINPSYIKDHLVSNIDELL